MKYFTLEKTLLSGHYVPNVFGTEVIRSNLTFYKVYSNGAGTYNAGNINP